ncbi:Phosphotransferase system, phosphocarrier protein HPr [Chloroherpeton thalassium ATCC 35110]|uniref:Phosphotransferase system, phosphocarrier protein HPr n=1 Tax=Chloroherpeton thalassium (strain ATCC 35110 / GB-78) TaxID=517418 RepID=B3QVU5_CHLT3|nr:HPr family phosphocarrier protein [Chloroherpeton thalassium]ACF13152.1 Phosphotransferase system, phosphocarrier protein HPr [Chloroherpeton thalassium ATCC 35110]
MIIRKVTVRNRAGLHTRPAAALVKLASRFRSDFFIEKDGMEINAKSIISVMTLAAPKGTKLKIKLDGEDENEAVEAIAKLFEDGFGEP